MDNFQTISTYYQFDRLIKNLIWIELKKIQVEVYLIKT
jgi:hypothetical protein